MKLKTLTLFTLLPLLALAQPELLSTHTQSIRAGIDLVAEQLSDINTSMPGPGSNLIGLDLAVRNGELAIRYNLADLKENEAYYNTSLAVKLNGRALFPTPDQFRGAIGRVESGGEHTITWINLMEEYLVLEGTLEVTLTAEVWGKRILLYGVDCNDPPEFTSRQRRPYYLAAGLGAVSIGAGQLFKQRRDDIWDNEYLTSQTTEEADTPYKNATTNHQTYLVLSWAGSALLAGSTVLYIIRQTRYQKRRQVYEENCRQNAIGLEPVIGFPSGNTPGGQAGFKLTFSF
ncbi:MAG: hypothetical protein H6558_01935 [Lewinellaceae bacterium]|nr:hypothetical protein [Lewinellaceae bacterium]MCB9286824.1 hypothetical protein [Lewinellaceae bacterium]